MALLLFLFPLGIMGQDKDEEAGPDTTLAINRIVSNDTVPTYIDVKVNAHVNGKPLNSYDLLEEMVLLEQIGNYEDTVPIQDVIPREGELPQYSYLSVLIMLDRSGSMRQRFNKDGKSLPKIELAKNAILNTMRKDKLPLGGTFFSTFDETNGATAELDTTALAGVKVPPPGEAKYTHLYECLNEKLKEMEDRAGERVIILVADGENDLAPGHEATVTKEEVLEKLSKMDSTFRIYPVGIGTEIFKETLQELVRATPNPQDTFQYNVGPDSLPYVMERISDALDWTHTVQFSSPTLPYTGNLRKISLMLGSEKAESEYKLGSVFNPFNENTGWQSIFLIGFLIIGVTFAIFIFVIPYLRWLGFRRNYVRRYWQVKKPGIAKYDPLTKDPFHDNDWVVVKCEHVTSLGTWLYEDPKGRKKKNQCIYYPTKCKDGVAHTESSDFFVQHGFYKKLNWFWHGAFGGFLAWCLWALFENFRDMIGYTEYLWSLASRANIQEWLGVNISDSLEREGIKYTYEHFIDPFFDDFFLGIFLGASLCFALSWVEERGHGRRLAWLRILLRTIIGAVLSMAVFGLGAYLHVTFFTGSSYFPGLISIVLMGLMIGLVLSIASSIILSRGLIAGLVSSVIAYQIYFFLPVFFFSGDYEWAKMISLLLLGGIMGYILVWVVSYLEDFEIEYISPKNFHRIVPVSKWLKAGQTVTIGRSPSAIVRIKWKDQGVEGIHAELTMENDAILLEPMAPMKINGKRVNLNSKVPLHHDDIIGFGETSITELQYKEKRRGR